MRPEPIENLPPHGRRGFFSNALARLVGPLADYIERKIPVPLSVVRTRLRPPGAIDEQRFLETCFRCGACADACPADAISLMQQKGRDDYGTPFVHPADQACVICDELACMKACPSGALVLVDRFGIRMGLARVDHELCVRSRGDGCTECVARCPLGETAIRIDDSGRIEVINPSRAGQGCTGCGVCEQACPTRPGRAIRIFPY